MIDVNSMSIRELCDEDARHHLHPLTNPVSLLKTGPEMIVRGEGIYLYTSDGRRIMDVGSGMNNVHIGYGNRRVCEAAFNAMQQLSFGQATLGRSNPWAAALSAKLTKITPEQYQHFFLATTGSEAVESSIKIALRYWRLLGKPAKRAVIGRRLSYHGNTLFAASLTGVESFHTQFGLPICNLVHHADSPYWFRDGKGRSREEFGLDVARALERQILDIGPENIAAFVGEPIQALGGNVIPPSTYWPEVQQICNRHGILLICDEIITGFGKTGQMFGFQTFDFEPDMFTVAKGLSSGYFPISAVAIGAKVGKVIQNSDEIFNHAFTNCGHPVAAAVALENLSIIEERGLVDRVRTDIGPYFAERLDDLLKLPFVGEVRSSGVIGGIDYNLPKEERDTLLKNMALGNWKRGMFMKGATLCLPMIISRQQIDEAIDILRDSLIEARHAM